MMSLSVVNSLLCFQISITANAFLLITASSVLVSIMWMHFCVRQALYIIMSNSHKDSSEQSVCRFTVFCTTHVGQRMLFWQWPVADTETPSQSKFRE